MTDWPGRDLKFPQGFLGVAGQCDVNFVDLKNFTVYRIVVDAEVILDEFKGGGILLQAAVVIVHADVLPGRDFLLVLRFRSCTNRRSARIGEKIFGLARKRRAGILTDFKRF